LKVFRLHGEARVRQWAWYCRLDCWAPVVSGWELPDQRAAMTEALAHLRSWHDPQGCIDTGCTERHIEWPLRKRDGSQAAWFYLAHPGVWAPVLPEGATQRDA
jgi:hypothetical protein